MKDDPSFNPKIGVAGLGLIGGSLALAFKKAGLEVCGYDRDEKAAALARKAGIPASAGPEDVRACDYIFVALYPEGIIDFIKSSVPSFRPGTVVIDCCGVKGLITRELFGVCRGRDFTFIGGHPMAGTERSGFAAASDSLFSGASFIMTPDQGVDGNVLDAAKSVVLKAGFGRVVVTTPEHHDRMIAFTSQLPHALACSYVKSECCPGHKGYSAGSYRDVSRVAHLDPELWADLFLDNRQALGVELDGLIKNLGDIRAAVGSGDRETLAKLLGDARKIKDGVDYV
jgi:prephenate dehydrogenase